MKYLAPFIFLLPSALDAGINKDKEIDRALIQASTTYQVPYRLLKAICYVESHLDPSAINVFDGGSSSYGLCQLKLATARSLNYTGNINELRNPYVNANFAAKYLRYQLTRYGQDWVRATSAYNRGSCGQKVKNQKYVNKVLLTASRL